MYAYVFEGRRYDVGDKLGFIEATIDFALNREDLREGVLEYLVKVVNRETGDIAEDEVAAAQES
jgi:UTP--glucose-1-phosphate uridylyltransferase